MPFMHGIIVIVSRLKAASRGDEPQNVEEARQRHHYERTPPPTSLLS
jgi:hypothetical protein